MVHLPGKGPDKQPVEIFSKTPYRSKHDAMHLLHELGNAYEPIRWLMRNEKTVDTDKPEKETQ